MAAQPTKVMMGKEDHTMHLPVYPGLFKRVSQHFKLVNLVPTSTYFSWER